MLNQPREVLYKRIDKRVDIMLENGLVEEAKQTYDDNKSKGAFQAIGHKELYGYLKGEIPFEEATELLKQQTRRYAKRQLTWFRKDERINWLYADKQEVLKDSVCLAENFLKEE